MKGLYKKLQRLGEGLHKCKRLWWVIPRGYLEVRTDVQDMHVMWTCRKYSVSGAISVRIGDNNKIHFGERKSGHYTHAISGEFESTHLLRWLEYEVDRILERMPGPPNPIPSPKPLQKGQSDAIYETRTS